MPLPTTRTQWDDLATRALDAYAAEQGAFLWPEIEANLGEYGWIHHNLDRSVPANRNPDPHHLRQARYRLVETGTLQSETVVLNDRPVTAWIDTRWLTSRRATAAARLAAKKRRLYRRWLAWTGDSRLCGSIADRHVFASIRREHGRTVWIPTDQRPGQARLIAGREIQLGGPLDASAAWVRDPQNPTAGFIPFAVEVKNVRAVLYPHHAEVWDLLAKMGQFPDAVPVLVARHLHFITFRFFRDIGAIGWNTKQQWFSHTIESQHFDEVVSVLGFKDAVRLARPDEPHAPTATWIGRMAEVGARQLTRWEGVAPIARDFSDLRNPNLAPPDRWLLWREFAHRIEISGMAVNGGWQPEGTPVEE